VIARVQSAGLLQGGSPASEHSVDLLGKRGIDLSTHRSQPLSPELLGTADLIVGMAREHVREAVVMVPDTFSRTFTLKELVRRAEDAGPREADEPFDQWLMRVHRGRTSRDLMGVSREDDVKDPIGLPRGAYVTMVSELDDLTGRLVQLGWGAVEREVAS
jgi:protein-tyrosine phosphatase